MRLSLAAITIWSGFTASLVATPVTGYIQTSLVASATDSDLMNPWGTSENPASPFWVSDDDTGKATPSSVSKPSADPISAKVFNGTAPPNDTPVGVPEPHTFWLIAGVLALVTLIRRVRA